MFQAMVQIGCGRHEQSSISNLVLYFIVLDNSPSLLPAPTALARDFRKVYHNSINDYVSSYIENRYSPEWIQDKLQDFFREFMQGEMDSEAVILDEIEKAGYSFSPYPRTPLVAVYLLSNMDEFVSSGICGLEPAKYSVFHSDYLGGSDGATVSTEIFDVVLL